jgi:hypothetical protein
LAQQQHGFSSWNGIQRIIITSNLCVPFSVLDAVSMTDDGWTDVCRWIYDRRRLSKLTGNNELRRCAVLYTDDPIFTCVGTDTFARIARTWYQVNQDFGMEMAIAQKRQVGTRMKRLGFNFYLTSSIIAAPPEKISRAREFSLQILDGAVISFDQYRSLGGGCWSTCCSSWELTGTSSTRCTHRTSDVACNSDSPRA